MNLLTNSKTMKKTIKCLVLASCLVATMSGLFQISATQVAGCTATAKCWGNGVNYGTVECTGTTCKSGEEWVECDGKRTECSL